MTDRFHFMPDEIHFMPEPITTKMEANNTVTQKINDQLTELFEECCR